MQYRINDDETLGEIQQLFHSGFPFLKLVFFENDIRNSQGVRQNRLIASDRAILGEFRLNKEDNGEFVLRGNMTVKELEQYIESLYCLHVQVLRQSANIWLGTTVTSHWTLDEQNRQGELLSSQMFRLANDH